MRSLSARELLDVWEAAMLQPALERPLTLLSEACPELPRAELARLSVGERNRRLLKLREWMFGTRLEGLAGCPQCGQSMEVALATADLLAGSVAGTSGEHVAEVGEYRIGFRLPDSLDLAAAADAGNPEAARQCLRDRCFSSAWRGEESVRVSHLPESVESAVLARMEESDPHLDIRLTLECAACQCRWQAPFEIASFLWIEIEAWARRLLREVHTLAVAHGWRESDILALSPFRRRCYLEMVGG
jgi:hypothetical protein